MRYSFHGKMRSTGQFVDGYVDAPTSTKAIDRLADEGIIGVYSVYPEPLPENPILVAGTPQAQLQTDGAPVVLTQLVDKLTTLIGQVEKLLSRPMIVSTDSASSRFVKRSNSAAPNNAQDAALRAIFQTNLDLRRSLEKFADLTSAMRPPENKPDPKREPQPTVSRPRLVAEPVA